MVIDQVGGIEVAGLKGGRIVQEGLDGGAGLTLCQKAAVIDILCTSAADDRRHGAGSIVHNDSGALQGVFSVLLSLI